jgi:hypothetical protein
MDYMPKRMEAFTRFLDDGRICMSNNAAGGRCEGSHSAAKHGSMPAPIAAASAPPSCSH